MRRAFIVGLVVALVGGGRVASAQTVNGAQCGDGDFASVGNACTTSDGGVGRCFAEMCSMIVEGGTDPGPCALCYAPGEEPPGDGGAIVVISTTTTTTTDDGGCRVGGTGTDVGSILVGVVAMLRVARRRKARGRRS